MISIGVAAALCACSDGDVLRSSEMDPSVARLGDAVLAIYVSPQAPIDTGDHGHVVLADADGEVRTVRTSGMDLGRLTWDEDGLFFSDRDRDYRLAATRLDSADSPKADYQLALFTIDDETVALYNDGFVGDGYVESVVRSDGRTSKRVEVAGAYWTVANCDGRVLGVTDSADVRRGSAAGPDSPDDSPMALVELYPETGQVIGVAPAAPGEAPNTWRDAPCVDDVIRVVTSVPEGETGRRPILRSWDGTTGAKTDVDLIDSTGGRLTLHPDDPGMSQSSTHGVVDGRLRWVTSRGQVMSTDIVTGVTTELFTLETRHDGADVTHILFTRRSVYALSGSARDLDEDVVLRRYDLSTGGSDELVRISDLNSRLWNGVYMRGFAVAPELIAHE